MAIRILKCLSFSHFHSELVRSWLEGTWGHSCPPWGPFAGAGSVTLYPGGQEGLVFG